MNFLLWIAAESYVPNSMSLTGIFTRCISCWSFWNWLPMVLDGEERKNNRVWYDIIMFGEVWETHLPQVNIHTYRFLFYMPDLGFSAQFICQNSNFKVHDFPFAFADAKGVLKWFMSRRNTESPQVLVAFHQTKFSVELLLLFGFRLRVQFVSNMYLHVSSCYKRRCWFGFHWLTRSCCGTRHGHERLSTVDGLFTFNHYWGCFKSEMQHSATCLLSRISAEFHPKPHFLWYHILLAASSLLPWI